MKSNRKLAEQIYPLAIINRTSAQMIRSSVHKGAADPRRDITRIDSIYGVFPKAVIGERNRHRCFSLSDRSSRAVPPEKMFEEIRSGVGLALPAKFRRRVKGMGGGEELTGDELIEARLDFIEDALDIVDGAERANNRGEEKETVNRRLDWCVYLHTLQTGTFAGWMNFYGLRCDEDASPTIKLFADKCFEVYKATTPEPLRPGEWHLPFVGSENIVSPEGYRNVSQLELKLKMSAARSAHLSYNDLETGMRMTVPRALDISERLKGGRILHASPFEHQATPDEHYVHIPGWHHPHEHGNLPGWRQYRKMLPGEAVAKLPEGYEL